MRILPLFVLLVCFAWQTSARPQDDSESRAIPSRGLLKRGLVGKGKPTTSTTTAAPEEEGDYDEEGDYPAEAEANEPSTEAPPSSTEGKKLVAGGVRPFRSNTDLLAALKRRRAQAAEAKLGHSVPAVSQSQDVQTEASVKPNLSKKRFNTATRETKTEEAPAPAKPSRSRFGRPTSRSFQETEPVEEQNDTAPATRTGRQFRRGGN
ncbi:uncharacterized protein LOC123718976 isoform X1 [Pieris brassicae]|uniref:Uncharacterized protein n=1 Tax=Pieris brassicae TaxID=7116 RepID=A0A9P0TW20_PIEBR|nr:uncharacterized protein LOC123718976 isoform X1 [Pieris brassicae]CAH4038903.1 unnamed protein product [Pieris brassicae]